jgi:hypothetical protein
MTAYSLGLVQMCGGVKLANEDVVVYVLFHIFSNLGHIIVLISVVVFYVFLEQLQIFTGLIYDTKNVLH